MRYAYVYDDTMQDKMVEIFESFMDDWNIGNYYSYDNGMNRIDVGAVTRALEKELNAEDFYFLDVSHAYGIGNNNSYKIYYQPKGSEERQIVGIIDLNKSLYSSMFARCTNCDGEAISDSYDIYPND